MAASGMLNQLPDSLASLLAEAELAALWEACEKRQIRPRGIRSGPLAACHRQQPRPTLGATAGETSFSSVKV